MSDPTLQTLDRIKIVLVNTSHPGNIGGAARAMANMGLKNLTLVDPLEFPSMQATARAAGADSVLDSASVYSSLEEAVADCSYVYGTTARLRSISWPQFDPQTLAQKIRESEGGEKIALVFGRERTGLSNEELDLCQALVHIPVDEAHTSLNLASAVMVLAFSIRSALIHPVENPKDIGKKHASPPVGSEQLQYYFQRLDTLLTQIGFYKGNATKVMRKLRRLYYKADASEEDIRILLGTITAMSDALEARDADSAIDEREK